MATKYHVGDRPKVYVTFRNEAGTATDPSDVRLVIRKPNGTETEVTTGFVHTVGSGYYEYYISIDMHGRWAGEWRGRGTLPEVEPWDFHVERSRLVTPVTP